MDGWLGWSAEEWSALGSLLAAGGAVATFVVAMIAALAAFRQVREARILREEQARPHVVVYFEPSQASTMHLDLVVENVGHTAARDVCVRFEPPLVSTMDNAEFARADPYFLREGIPTLPPGIAYRMLFESGPERFQRDDLPRRYVATVSFADRRGERESDKYVLDLDTFYGYEALTIYGEHHTAKALREIAQSLKRWTTHGNGVKIYAVDEDSLQARWAKEAELRMQGKEQDNQAPNLDRSS
jgi:hypothetical protein